jgi:hypothetical protein
MKHLICLSLLLLGIAMTAPSNAAIEGGTGDSPVGLPANPAGGSSQPCDFWAIKDSLHGTESGGAPNEKACAMNVSGSDSGARGKYQFIPGTWNGYYSNPDVEAQCHQQANGCTYENMGNMQTHPQCCGVQECFMDVNLAQNLVKVRSPECQELLGKQIKGCNKDGCLECAVTESGLLAGMHLGGANGVCGALSRNTQGASDDLGTSVGYYVCKHGGLPVPGQCDPVPYEVGTSPPTLTQQQVDTMIELGRQDQINIGGGTIKSHWIYGLMLMAEQFTANMVKQLEAIGMFFDAKEQLEAQRDFQERVAEAHRDYHPSEQMCTFGSFSTNLASTERRADLTRAALSKQVIQRELGSGDSQATTVQSDTLSRLKRYRSTFCNPKDNGVTLDEAGMGLQLLCKHKTEAHMQNRDIDFTRSVDKPLTLDINLTDDKVTDDEMAVFALIDNLFAHAPLPRFNPSVFKDDPAKQIGYRYHYTNLRSIVAMRGIARNSMSNIIALKTASPDESERSGPYLKALMKEMGLPDDEVEKVLGENPSYYAQMEFLSKKIYQNPNFYTALYDKPANVERIRAAMTAVKLMNDRDIHAAMLRREMLLSMMLELRLRERADVIYRDTNSAIYKSR